MAIPSVGFCNPLKRASNTFVLAGSNILKPSTSPVFRSPAM